MKKTPKPIINRLIIPIIERALAQVTIENLKRAAKISLVRFYNRQYAEISRISPLSLNLIILSGLLASRTITGLDSRVLALRSNGIFITNNQVTVPTQNLYGVPIQEYMADYIKKNVKPVLDRLSEQRTLDPNDVTGRNSLRNLAEMEVRYNDHLQQIDDLKAAGHKLVIASTHADCSDRCRRWQGRVYSLDGTSGTTDDGRKFVPLEEATNVPYTTKAGVVYMNGLLGFNCRHYLVPYKSGYSFPKPNVEEERKQYKITLKQRAMEREVRRWRTEALTNKGIDNTAYKYAKMKANEWNDAYIQFSRENKRAYYPSRTKIL